MTAYILQLNGIIGENDVIECADLPKGADAEPGWLCGIRPGKSEVGSSQ